MSEGIRIVRQPGVDPRSEEGLALFAELFGGDADAGALKLFPHSIAAGEPTQAHVHTAAVAACVTRGRFQIGTGREFLEREELEPGDFLFIPKQVPHEEQVLGLEPVEFVVAHLEGFHTLEV